ncbi:MAG: hypothetical protein U1F36_20150 [Planctomycetota bacterium]
MTVLRRAAIALLAIEACLQLLAFAAWRRAWVGPDGRVDHATALVVGDDLAFEEGVASREDAWPAEVARLLARTHPGLRVVNGAAPGRDSHDVVLNLERQLDRVRPALVYLRCGATDLRRGGVGRVDDDEFLGRARPFDWSFRTWDLLLGLLSEPSARGDRDALGIWHAGDVELQLAEDGTAHLGPSAGTWSAAGTRITIAFPGVDAVEAELIARDGADELRVDMPTAKLRFVRGAKPGEVAVAVETLSIRGAWAEARWLLETNAQSSRPSASALASLVELDVKEGRMDETDARLARLGARSDDPPWHAEELRAWLALGRCREVVDALLRDPSLLDRSTLLRERLATMPDDAERARLATALGTRAGNDALVARLRAPRDPAAALDAKEREARSEVLQSNLRRAVELCRFYGAEPVLMSPAEVAPAAEAVGVVARATGAALIESQPRRSALREALLSDLDARLRAPH